MFPFKAYDTPEEEIADINNAKLCIGTNGEVFHLYDFQEEFIRDLYEKKYVSALKSRRCGFSVLYLLHIIFSLRKYLETYGFIETKNIEYLFISFNGASCKQVKEVANRIFEEMRPTYGRTSELKELFGECVRIFPASSIREKMMWNIGRRPEGFKEVYFDEYNFFETYEDVINSMYTRTYGTVAGATSLTDGKNVPYSKIEEWMYHKGNEDGGFSGEYIPWWKNPVFNKNLEWVRGNVHEKEPTIDEEGNVKFDRQRWAERLVDGWTPSSPEMNKMKGIFFDKDKISELLFH